MGKFMLAERSRYLLFPSVSRNCHSVPRKPLISFITLLSTPFRKAYSSIPLPNPANSVLFNYLVDSLKFSKARAFEISSHFPNARSLEKPEAVIHFFRALSLSNAQIQSMVNIRPKILFANVEKILKPKVTYFQELGLTGNHLGAFLTKLPSFSSASLDRTLKPCIRLIIEILKNDGSNRNNEKITNDVFRIITRSNRIVLSKSTFESNVSYLKSCGIVGSQLSCLLVGQPRMFSSRTDKVMQVVSIATNMGFVVGSRMFVYGVLNCSHTTTENLNRKYDVIQSFGFSRNEVTEMFLKKPSLLGFSEARMRCGIEFFLNNLMFDKSFLVASPVCLTYNIEKRVIPRCRVVEVIKSRQLLKREPSISRLLSVTDEDFVEAYISRFVNDAQDLMLAYDGRFMESSKN